MPAALPVWLAVPPRAGISEPTICFAVPLVYAGAFFRLYVGSCAMALKPGRNAGYNARYKGYIA